MVTWLLFILNISIEVGGSLYFFDIFMERNNMAKLHKASFIIYFIAYFGLAFTVYWIGMFKMILYILVLSILNMYFYKVAFKQSLFFSGLCYSTICLVDYIVVYGKSVVSMQIIQLDDGIRHLALIAKIVWLVFLLIFKKSLKTKMDYKLITDREWLQLSIIPIFTLTTILLMILVAPTEISMQRVYEFVAIGLVGIDYVVVHFMQDILEKEEKIKVAVMANQNQEKQLEAYKDMRNVYDSQRRKMHDYKNQIGTIQTLIKSNDIQSAIDFTEQLTESISVDMSAINTNHAVINAVLNQKFRSMQEKNISMIFKVGDLHEVKLKEEEIVILLSNLLDNAIKASEKVQRQRGRAVIRLKLVYEDEKMILAIRNPVIDKVEIIDDMVVTKENDGHGIGLLNVKAVVDKYEGDMVLSCDDNPSVQDGLEFKVVVVI
jgi:sensor histidine kinase YesM